MVLDEATLNIDEQPLKYTWVFDIREKTNPVSIYDACRRRRIQDYVKMGGQFGPQISCTRTGRDRSSPRQRSSRRGRARACERSTLRIRSGRRRRDISCRPSRPNGRNRCEAVRKFATRPDLFVAQDGLMRNGLRCGVVILQWKG